MALSFMLWTGTRHADAAVMRTDVFKCREQLPWLHALSVFTSVIATGDL